MRTYITNIVVATGLLSGLVAFAQAGEAGKVVFVTGAVSIANRPAQLDAAVQEGDELTTGADGYIYVKTVDQGFLVLRPGSRARIVAYHIDEKNPANTRVKFELLNGVARSISGNGVKHARQNFRFNTPVAAIGVRGTDFVVSTDQQTSRVTVVSGGVVVSGFSGGCGPEGGGPCEGGASRELFAGQSDMMLQVERGQKAPQLLRSPVPSSPAESPAAPARPDEPVGKAAPAGNSGTSSSSATGTATSTTSTTAGTASPSSSIATPGITTIVTPATYSTESISLDAQKSVNVLNSSKPVTTASVQPSVKPPPVVLVPIDTDGTAVTPVQPTEPLVPVVTPPVTVPPEPKETIWGRYAAIAGGVASKEVRDEVASGKYTAPLVLGNYQLARLKSTTYVAPREGKASFVLADSDAVLQRTGRTAVQAAVQDAQLHVDFSTRTFQTGLTVVGDDIRVPVSISGNVTTLGELVNVNSLTSSSIRGYLGGSRADQAAYIFQYTNPGVTVNGATTWKR